MNYDRIRIRPTRRIGASDGAAAVECDDVDLALCIHKGKTTRYKSWTLEMHPKGFSVSS
jgi:hypothetical protein